MCFAIFEEERLDWRLSRLFQALVQPVAVQWVILLHMDMHTVLWALGGIRGEESVRGMYWKLELRTPRLFHSCPGDP